ncbi:MAG TPA: T9SS type A sorting domain-containing protein [Bacteroidota bacterium]|nr:T9SS type A sorting domain-containing protein [Bacteroidota bacterium]
MLKKIFTTFLVLMTVGAVAVFAGQTKKATTHYIIAPEVTSSLNQVSTVPPSFNKGAKMQKVDAGTRTTIGTTYYDLLENYGAPTMIEYYEGHTYMIYIKSAAGGASRSIQYVYYDGTTFTAPQDVIAPSTQTTYFSQIDVWKGGDVDGFAGVAAGWAGSGHSYYGLEASAGGGNFTTTQVSPDRDAGTLTLDSTGTVLFKDSNGRTNYKISRSTDFGQTWTVADSNVCTSATTPGGQTTSSLDVPLISYPDGSIGIPCELSGTDLVPNPAWGGTATQDSSYQVGFFKSTDKGSTWKWNRVGRDGEQFTPGFYNFVANWGGQVDMAVDNTGKEHMAIQGDAAYLDIQGSDTTARETMDMLYWDKTNGFKSVVSFDRKDTLIGYYMSGNNRSSNNDQGCCFPSIALSSDGQTIVEVWSQAAWTHAGIDTMATGVMRFDLWYNVSFDGGATWGTAQNLSNFAKGTESAIQSSMAANLQKVNSNTWRARVMYIGDLKGSAASTDTLDNVYYQEFDVVNSGTSVGAQNNVTPNKFELVQNYPNPFNPSTQINYSIANNAHVTLKVYNVLGQEVASLVNGNETAGSHSVTFNASNLASGMYIYKLASDNFTSVKKMMLLK